MNAEMIRGRRERGPPLGEHGQDFVLAQDEDVLAVEGDVGARVLSEEDLVSHLHVEGDLGAVVEDLAVAGGEHFALLRLLLGRVGDDDPSARGLLLLDAADDQAVMEWTDSIHVHLLWLDDVGKWTAEASAPAGRSG